MEAWEVCRVDQPDEHELHTSVASFIVWLAGTGTAPALRHAYPPVVDEFLRWRHPRLAAGEACDRDGFLAALEGRGVSYPEREIASDAIGYYVRFLGDQPS